jgi:hypothetical protein
MDKQQQVEQILADVAQGRKTVESLVAQRKLYEGGNMLLTDAITIHRTNPIGAALALLYESIGEVLTLLQPEEPNSLDNL